MPTILLGVLTKRQLDVARLLRQGKSTKLIAHELDVSTRAVEHHLTHIYRKLNVSSRVEAVVKLIDLFGKEQPSGIPSRNALKNSYNDQ